MPRINTHEEPKLKSMFRFNVPPNRSTLANMMEASEAPLLTILYNNVAVADAFHESLPPYIVRAMSPEQHDGFVKLTTEPEEETMNSTFDGVVYTYELNPMYDRAETMNNLYRVLKEVSEPIAEELGLEVDWDEKYAYQGSHYENMKPLGISVPQR